MMKSLGNLLMVVAAVFAPVKAAVLTVFVLVLADLILGVWAAHKRKEPITSAGLRRTAVKMFLYEAALLLGFLAETYLLGEYIPVCKIASAFVGLVEIKSVIENLNEIGGGSLFKGLIDKLNSVNLDKSE